MSFKNILKKIEEFDFLYKKIKGGYYGIFTAIAGITTILIASILYFLAEPFNFFSHWISNLGGKFTNLGQSPNGSNIVFSIGLIITALLALPFIVDLASKLLNKNQKFPWLVICAVVASVITFIGLVSLALFDMKSHLYTHAFASTIFFISAALTMFIFSLAMFFNAKISWKQAIVGIITSGVALFFLLTFIPHLGQSGGIINLIGSTSPKLALSRFFEWMFLFSFLFWLIETGLFSLKRLE